MRPRACARVSWWPRRAATTPRGGCQIASSLNLNQFVHTPRLCSGPRAPATLRRTRVALTRGAVPFAVGIYSSVHAARHTHTRDIQQRATRRGAADADGAAAARPRGAPVAGLPRLLRLRLLSARGVARASCEGSKGGREGEGEGARAGQVAVDEPAAVTVTVSHTPPAPAPTAAMHAPPRSKTCTHA